MSTDSQQPIDCDALTAELRETKPGRASQTEGAFVRMLPEIRSALERNVTRKVLLAVLAKHGLKLSPVKFKALMEKHGQPSTEINGEVTA
ncbi:hypothetical protein [Hydrogenophaga sp. NH-16]|uniref:hypothetical protein n=1 Tax=Hydrogenophaga sp. NH-16 TaxID=2184519 RepID=UPI000FDB2A44|nr:hypothetical protein [Hydrogenophaga sp. NH-16]